MNPQSYPSEAKTSAKLIIIIVEIEKAPEQGASTLLRKEVFSNRFLLFFDPHMIEGSPDKEDCNNKKQDRECGL